MHPQRLSEVEGEQSPATCASGTSVSVRAGGKLLLAGVMLRDPARFDLRGVLKHGRDVEIDTNVILQGHVVLRRAAPGRLRHQRQRHR